MEITWNIIVQSLFYLNKIHGKHHLHHQHIAQPMQIYTGNSIFFYSIVFWRTYWNYRSKTLFLRILAGAMLNLCCKFPAFLWLSQSVFFCYLRTFSAFLITTLIIRDYNIWNYPKFIICSTQTNIDMRFN